jgi:hypothetical protein
MEISVAALSFLILAAAFGSQALVIHGESIGPSPVARCTVTQNLGRRHRGTLLPAYECAPFQTLFWNLLRSSSGILTFPCLKLLVPQKILNR